VSTVPRVDLATATGVLRFAELRRAEMVRCFERLGRFESNGNSFGAFALLTHDVRRPVDPSDMDGWGTGKRLGEVAAVPFDLPRVLAAFVPAHMQSKLFAEGLRGLCKHGRAVGVLIMSEQWHGRTSSMEERRSRPARIKDWDDRREALIMRLEHRAAGGHTWRAWAMARLSRRHVRKPGGNHRPIGVGFMTRPLQSAADAAAVGADSRRGKKAVAQ
jgi:hypothetical protein